MFDTRIYMIDENDHEFEVDMSLLDEVGYLSGVYIEGPRISEEFVLDEQQQFDAEMQYKDILRSIEEEEY